MTCQRVRALYNNSIYNNKYSLMYMVYRYLPHHSPQAELRVNLMLGKHCNIFVVNLLAKTWSARAISYYYASDCDSKTAVYSQRRPIWKQLKLLPLILSSISNSYHARDNLICTTRMRQYYSRCIYKHHAVCMLSLFNVVR